MSWFDDQGLPPSEEGGVSYYGGSPTFDETAVGRSQPQTPVSGAQPGQQAPPGQQSGGFQPYSDDLFLSIIHKHPPTYEGAKAAAAELDSTFGPGVVSLIDHPTKLDKFRLPGGRVADMMYSAGGPNAAWADSVQLEGPGGGGGAAGPGPGQIGSDPSFAFRMAEGQKALERSAASKGTLLTGGTLKALTRYAQDYASTEYGNVFDRLYKTSALGLNAAQSAANVGSSYGNQQGNAGANYGQNASNLITQQGNANAAGKIGSSNAWGTTIGNVVNGVTQLPWFNNTPER